MHPARRCNLTSWGTLPLGEFGGRLWKTFLTKVIPKGQGYHHRENFERRLPFTNVRDIIYGIWDDQAVKDLDISRRRRDKNYCHFGSIKLYYRFSTLSLIKATAERDAKNVNFVSSSFEWAKVAVGVAEDEASEDLQMLLFLQSYLNAYRRTGVSFSWSPRLNPRRMGLIWQTRSRLTRRSRCKNCCSVQNTSSCLPNWDWRHTKSPTSYCGGWSHNGS